MSNSYPFLIPSEVRANLHMQMMQRAEKEYNELKDLGYAGPGELSPEKLGSIIWRAVFAYLRESESLTMQWLIENNPDCSSADIDRVERQIRECGDEYRKWAIDYLESYSSTVRADAISRLESQREHLNTCVDIRVQSWIVALWTWARERSRKPNSSEEDRGSRSAHHSRATENSRKARLASIRKEFDELAERDKRAKWMIASAAAITKKLKRRPKDVRDMLRDHPAYGGFERDRPARFRSKAAQ